LENWLLKQVNEVSSRLPADSFKGLSVLVTGGAGFLGSWMCDALVELGAEVVCLDNLSTGRVGNVEHLMGREGFRFVKGDVSTWKPDKSFNVIIHGASIPSPDDYVRRPVETMMPNSLGLLNMLEHARKTDAAVLYTSTSEVYGDAKVIPTPEEYWGNVNPVGVRSCYDESKRFGEALCMAYHRQYGVDVRIARIFNTYGPRLDPEARYARVIPRFIMQALRGEPLTIHGDGRQTRSFCYVTDMVEALLKMAVLDSCRGEVINLGSPHETPIIDLAETVRRLVGSKSKLRFLPPRPDDPRRRCPDISKAKCILGWEPRVSLEEGLKWTIRWFREVMG